MKEDLKEGSDPLSQEYWWIRWGHRLQLWKARAPRQGSIFRLLLAAILGVSTGYGALFFRSLIKMAWQLGFPGTALRDLRGLPWWRLLLPPIVGGAIVTPFVQLLAPEAKGHGVPEVKDACANLGGRIRPRVALIKTIASGVCIGSGGSVGREGPIVQIGSSLGSAFGRLVGLRGRGLIDFVAAGSAAGIAATFNAPIAGVVFAVEIILGRGSPRHFGPVVVAAVTATVVTHMHLGKNPAFIVPAYTLASGWELLLYVILGILAGVVGVAFTRGLYLLEDLWGVLPFPLVHGVFGGAFIGIIALKYPEILGVGYAHIEAVLGAGTGDALLLQAPAVEAQLLVLVAIKILATGTSIGSGGSGGIFAPSLFMGSSLGGAFGGIASRLMPAGKIANPSAYALVGMGAVVGAATHAPLTAILIVFELCDHHSIMLPLMLATVIATALSMALHRESIYTEKLARRGAGGGGDETPSERVLATRVREVMQPLAATVHSNARLAAIVNQAHAHDTHEVYVVDEDRQVLGVVTMDDIASHVQDPAARRQRLRAGTLMHAVATVTAETSIAECMKALEERKHEELPVVDDKMRLIGSISRGDLLAYTSREVLRHEAVLELVDDVAPGHEEIWLADDETRGAIEVSGVLVGKTLRELNLRTRYSINVYAVRRDEGSGVPDPDRPLAKGEVLVVVGPTDEIARLQELAEAEET